MLQLSPKNLKTVDACRFCWMCRHICPIGNATGQERNTSRARALGLSMVAREACEFADFVDNLYECALCGACTKECMTGWDPTAFTAEAKLEAALQGLLPAHISAMLEKLEKTGNVYGLPEADLPVTEAGTDTLLFLGRDARRLAPECARTAVEVLKRAGVAVTVLEQEPSSGADLFFLVGAAEETRRAATLAAECLNRFRNVIVYDPADAKMFRREYVEWSIPLTARVETFTSALARLVADGSLRVKPVPRFGPFAFQDPPALARDLEETACARSVLAACGECREMLMHGRDTNLAGNRMMAEYMPDAMGVVARRRWREALAVGASVLVTAQPGEYLALRAAKPENAQVFALEQVVARCGER